MCLPWSVRDLYVTGDGWTDDTARGYMEVSPEDFENLLKAREYERRDGASRVLHEDEYMQTRKHLRVATSYYWEGSTSYTFLATDSSRTWVYFEYARGLTLQGRELGWWRE